MAGKVSASTTLNLTPCPSKKGEGAGAGAPGNLFSRFVNDLKKLRDDFRSREITLCARESELSIMLQQQADSTSERYRDQLGSREL